MGLEKSADLQSQRFGIRQQTSEFLRLKITEDKGTVFAL